MAEPTRVTNRENVGVVKTGARASSNGRASAGMIIEGRPGSVAWGACATPHATAKAAPLNLHQSSLEPIPVGRWEAGKQVVQTTYWDRPLVLQQQQFRGDSGN